MSIAAIFRRSAGCVCSRKHATTIIQGAVSVVLRQHISVSEYLLVSISGLLWFRNPLLVFSTLNLLKSFLRALSQSLDNVIWLQSKISSGFLSY